MPIPRPEVDLHRPPPELDEMVEWFDRVCQNLVLLEPYSLADIQCAVGRFLIALDGHVGIPVSRVPAVSPNDRCRREHLRFRESLEELRGLLAVVERDDHGGHRQALGQYGRVLTEAFRDHRTRERRASADIRAVDPPDPRTSS